MHFAIKRIDLKDKGGKYKAIKNKSKRNVEWQKKDSKSNTLLDEEIT